MHGSDGIFSLKSIQGGVTGIRSWIICRQSFIMLFPVTVMPVSGRSGEQVSLPSVLSSATASPWPSHLTVLVFVFF